MSLLNSMLFYILLNISLSLQYENESQNTPYKNEELGRSTWLLLHSMGANIDTQLTMTVKNKEDVFNLIITLSKIYPCKKCVNHFQKYIRFNPPVIRKRRDISWWICKFHNSVNFRLGKQIYDCMDILENNTCETCNMINN